MQAAAAPLFGMALPQQCQRANALNDVISLPVRGCGVMNRRTRDGRETVRAAARRGHRVKGARKQCRQFRVGTDGDQTFSQSVKFLAAEREGAVASRPPLHHHLSPFAPRVLRAGGKGCDSRAPIQHTTAVAYQPRESRRPMMAFTPALFGGERELNCTVQVAGIGEGNRRASRAVLPASRSPPAKALNQEMNSGCASATARKLKAPAAWRNGRLGGG